MYTLSKFFQHHFGFQMFEQTHAISKYLVKIEIAFGKKTYFWSISISKDWPIVRAFEKVLPSNNHVIWSFVEINFKSVCITGLNKRRLHWYFNICALVLYRGYLLWMMVCFHNIKFLILADNQYITFITYYFSCKGELRLVFVPTPQTSLQS